MLTATTNPTKTEVVTVGNVTQQVYAEQYVRTYFSDIPIMAEISRCESRFRQFNINGNVLRGEQNQQDIGIMQINEKFHLNTALKMDIDLYTLDGNLSYARKLYEKMGTKPWKYSKKCWEGVVLALAK